MLSRRRLLGGAAVAAGAAVLARSPLAAATGAIRAPATVDLGGVAVVPRAEWGGDLAPTGSLPAEPEVRYLLVHHSVDPGNGYVGGDVPGILRGFVRFHQSGRGWPDLAYNFLVDRFGTVWEGRTGSLSGPVAGDATGGNQGFDQLCCFIGNHQADEPSPEAFAAMGRLLGALAGRYGIALVAGATATFVSRGSNRHPAGATVTTPTVAGHRDMSRTQCPGDRVAARLPELRLLAAGAGGPVPAPATTAAPPATAATPDAPPATTAPPPAATPATTTTTTPAPATTPASTSTTATPAERASAGKDGGDGGPGGAAVVAAGALAVAGVAAGATAARRRRPASEAPRDA